MYTPETSKHFKKYVDPSGVVSYILTTRIAPVQQSMYFLNSSISADGRYLWFMCAFPPAAGHTAAVIDFQTDAIHYYPETGGGSGHYVDPRSGDLWWCTPSGIFKRSPQPVDPVVRMIVPPQEIQADHISSMGTHITFTEDYSEVLTDIITRNGSYLVSFHLKEGTYKVWYKTERGIPYNHAQICPGNPNLGMCAHEGSFDLRNRFVPPPMVDGIYPRLQIISRDSDRKMLIPVENYATHEWWSRNGKYVYYCGINRICRDRLDGTPGETLCYTPLPNEGNGTWHGFSSECDRYFLMDGHLVEQCWRGCPSTVRFYNAETKNLVNIITKNPALSLWTPEESCPYHIDPHPRFVLQDTWVTHTTTVRGHVDVALTPVEQLIQATT